MCQKLMAKVNERSRIHLVALQRRQAGIGADDHRVMAGAKERSPEWMGVWSSRRCDRGAMRKWQHVEDDEPCQTQSSGKDPNSPATFGVLSLPFLANRYRFERHWQDFAFQQDAFGSDQSTGPQLEDGNVRTFRDR